MLCLAKTCQKETCLGAQAMRLILEFTYLILCATSGYCEFFIIVLARENGDYTPCLKVLAHENGDLHC